MQSRSLNAVTILVMLISLFAAAFAPANWTIAAPRDSASQDLVQAQTDEGTPPLIQPSDDSTTQEEPEEPDDGVDGGLPPVEASDDLGDGGQPEGLPREIVVGDARFLYDRSVPLDPEALSVVDESESLTVYAATDEGPFDAVYVSGVDGAALARYLPERIGAADVACPTEAAEIGQLDAGDAVYVFAGFELDLTTDTLQEIGTSDGNPVYAEADAGQPFPEVFVATGDGLLRFVIAGGDGRPASLADSLAFEGTLLSFVADVTDQVDPGNLAKVGCAGPYPVYTAADAAEGSTVDRYVRAGGRLFQYSGEMAPAASPADAPTEVPTEPLIVVPTEEPTEVPTEAPTEAPTEVPTEAPTEVATEVPTEVPAEPTEAPVEPTEAPVEATEAPVEATEAPVVEPTTAPTEAPAEDATEVPVEPTEEPAVAVPTEAPADGVETTAESTSTVEIPSTIVEAADAAGLPPQVEVQNTSYVFTQVDVDIDIQTLVQVEVVTINNTEVTIYAEQEVAGAVPVLYCVANNGESIGRYVPVAATNPTPPAELPPTIEVENTTYVFNQVNIDIDVQTLVQVNVIVVQNVELTIYADQDVEGQPTRYYAVSPDGLVVGQYVESSLVVSVVQETPPPTAQLQPPAFVPTQAPDAPPAAAVTAVPDTRCDGDPGEVNDQGLPSRLPARFQLGGIAYALVGPEAPDAVGELTAIGCIGAFEVATVEGEDRAQVLYLRYTGQGAAGESVYRFETAVTYDVEFEVTGRARVIAGADQEFRLLQAWQQSIYSSITVILFAEDPEDAAPDVFYAVNIFSSVSGDAVGEYRISNDTDTPSEEMVAAAEQSGLNPDLIVEGQRYLLVNVYVPSGTTTNGFVTLFAATVEGESNLLLGRDVRRLELFIYQVIPAEQGG
ncbi:MAG: hypothetical protein H0V37_05125 [Chloroflexia bacterium]|nr:hypothetical protein [Chloroflexia bacterium]